MHTTTAITMAPTEYSRELASQVSRIPCWKAIMWPQVVARSFQLPTESQKSWTSEWSVLVGASTSQSTGTTKKVMKPSTITHHIAEPSTQVGVKRDLRLWAAPPS